MTHKTTCTSGLQKRFRPPRQEDKEESLKLGGAGYDKARESFPFIDTRSGMVFVLTRPKCSGPIDTIDPDRSQEGLPEHQGSLGCCCCSISNRSVVRITVVAVLLDVVMGETMGGSWKPFTNCRLTNGAMGNNSMDHFHKNLE